MADAAGAAARERGEMADAAGAAEEAPQWEMKKENVAASDIRMIGRKTTIVVSVDMMIARFTSAVPETAASRGDAPSARRR